MELIGGFLFSLVLISIPIAIGYALYVVPKRLGYKKTGIVLSVVFFIAVIALVTYINFEDNLFSKNDAKAILADRHIKLKDDFTLIDFESDDGFLDHHDKLVLGITRNDKLAFLADTLPPPFRTFNNNTADSATDVYRVQKTQNENGNWEYMYIRPSEDIIDYSVVITNLGDTLTVDEYH